MIDPKLMRAEPEKVINMLKDRNVELDISQLLEIDRGRRELITELESYKIQMNNIYKDISTKKRQGIDITEILTETQKI